MFQKLNSKEIICGSWFLIFLTNSWSACAAQPSCLKTLFEASCANKRCLSLVILDANNHKDDIDFENATTSIL